ncbi:MAG: LuxR C-terminal-related transcriptional regulator, partial [Acetobacteraceae bacterium]|nr:LuxR C-terminal-related transcriptional regulator [Acetobacteraceae bacterium]
LRSGALRVRHGVLGAADRVTETRLRAAIADALAARDGSVQGLKLGDDTRPVRALIMALDPPSGTFRPRLAAILLLPEDPPQHAERVIQAMFGLTPVEARIVKLLGDGQTPNEAARTMRMRPGTLRGYMKSIFVKLDVHRQSELVRLVCTTAGLLRGRQTASPGASASSAA